MLHSWCGQRAAQIGGWIAFCSTRGDGIAENLTACAAEATGGLVTPSGLHFAEDGQQLGGVIAAIGRSPISGYANSSSHVILPKVASLRRPSLASFPNHSSETRRKVFSAATFAATPPVCAGRRDQCRPQALLRLIPFLRASAKETNG